MKQNKIVSKQRATLKIRGLKRKPQTLNAGLSPQLPALAAAARISLGTVEMGLENFATLTKVTLT